MIVITGVNDSSWHAPEWLARNVIFFVERRLTETHHGSEITHRLRTAFDAGQRVIHLADLLGEQHRANAWATAMRAAAEDAAAEPPSAWNLPSAHPAFASAFTGLLGLQAQKTGEAYEAMLASQSALDAVMPLRFGAT